MYRQTSNLTLFLSGCCKDTKTTICSNKCSKGRTATVTKNKNMFTWTHTHTHKYMITKNKNVFGSPQRQLNVKELPFACQYWYIRYLYSNYLFLWFTTWRGSCSLIGEIDHYLFKISHRRTCIVKLLTSFLLYLVVVKITKQ